MVNDFNVKRTAFANITIPNTATTVTTGVFIPKGAIITGIRWMSGDAVTIANASATVNLQVGSVPLATAWIVKNMGAQTVVGSTALATAAGIYIGDATLLNELNLVAQASSNTAATCSYDFYVDYIYSSSHE